MTATATPAPAPSPYHRWIARTVEAWEGACHTLPLDDGDKALAHVAVLEGVLALQHWMCGIGISEEGRDAIRDEMVGMADALQHLEESLQTLADEGHWGEEYEEAIQAVVEDCLYDLETAGEALARLADEPEPQPEPEPEPTPAPAPASAIPADLA